MFDAVSVRSRYIQPRRQHGECENRHKAFGRMRGNGVAGSPRRHTAWQSGGEQRELFVEGELHRVEEREGGSGDDSEAWRRGMRRASHPDRVASPSMRYAKL